MSGELTVTRHTLPLPVSLPEEEPPADLTPESFADQLYWALGPLAGQDPAYDWALLILCNAIGVMFQEVEDLARDTPDGPGWSPLLDLSRCPEEALPWLSQFVGVRLQPDDSDAEDRARIAATDGWRRGTPAALIASAQATLTGNQVVNLYERQGDPYALLVQTLTYETPDQAATLAAILAQKPGGLVLTYAAIPGQTYTSFKSGNATYAVAKGKYATYRGLLTNQPGV